MRRINNSRISRVFALSIAFVHLWGQRSYWKLFSFYYIDLSHFFYSLFLLLAACNATAIHRTEKKKLLPFIIIITIVIGIIECVRIVENQNKENTTINQQVKSIRCTPQQQIHWIFKLTDKNPMKHRRVAVHRRIK